MANYQQLAEDVYIGPQPTEADLQQARQQGIRTVIDFRMPSETAAPNAALARASGLDYVNVAVDKSALSDASIDELDAAMRQHPGPWLLHCATGARAAMLLALRQARQAGWTADRTFAAAEAMGFRLQDMPAFAAFIRKARGG